MSKNITTRLGKSGLFFFWLLVVVIWLVFPFYYAILTSLQSGTAIFQPGLLPVDASLENYRQIFLREYFSVNILNSVIIATSVVSLSLFFGVLASYALARVDFSGRKTLLLTILAVSMFPQIAVLSGMYQMYVAWRSFLQIELGMQWSHALSLSWLSFSYLIFTLPFTIWTITAYMRAIPQELEDAALVDGASYTTIIFRIFLPTLWPALITTGLMAFVTAWNEFLFALTFTSQESERTATVAISMISGIADYQVPWGTIMAASVIITIPIILLVLIFQRRLISGLTSGAVKG